MVMPNRGGDERERFREPCGDPAPLGGVERVVRAAQRGEPRAVDELVRAISPYVGRICGAIALDDADDAMQETLLAVIRNLRSLREPAAARAWVRRIAVREAIRAAKRRPMVAEVEALAAADVDVDTVLDVRAVLERLSPDQRAVLVLRDLDGMAEADMASLLSVTTGTIKSRLHRARAAFARRWSP
jgi:RNA polymerase sigma-70 factor (ECF subfamily)